MLVTVEAETSQLSRAGMTLLRTFEFKVSHCCLCVGNVERGYIYSNARTPLRVLCFHFY